ncbi:MAG: hypothetical protein CVV08_22115 [Gammaproteobacteria bacterium HGW-Gammaproteobacteria-12]|nr:MAG: hypothetical protein CVV08_22115 [Gammaproteobacteria bacterium HGW-Gammaproteobacteria-12]
MMEPLSFIEHLANEHTVAANIQKGLTARSCPTMSAAPLLRVEALRLIVPTLCVVMQLSTLRVRF